jgi:hypothetical protein
MREGAALDGDSIRFSSDGLMAKSRGGSAGDDD